MAGMASWKDGIHWNNIVDYYNSLTEGFWSASCIFLEQHFFAKYGEVLSYFAIVGLLVQTIRRKVSFDYRSIYLITILFYFMGVTWSWYTYLTGAPGRLFYVFLFPVLYLFSIGIEQYFIRFNWGKIAERIFYVSFYAWAVGFTIKHFAIVYGWVK